MSVARSHSVARPAPTANANLRVRRFGDDEHQPIQFYLFQDVVEELVFAARYEEEHPYGAVLTGSFGVDAGRGFVEVTGFTAAATAADVAGLYTALRAGTDEWFQAGHDDAVAGLFVAQRGCRGRVDEEMGRIHYTLFNVPFQPLLAFDPDSGDFGVAARGPGIPLFSAAFRVVAVRPALKDPEVSGMTSTGVGEEE